MTVQELSQVYHLNREIEMNKRRLEELRAKIGATTPKLSGMPHSPNNTDSQTEQIAAEIVDLEAITKALQIPDTILPMSLGTVGFSIILNALISSVTG